MIAVLAVIFAAAAFGGLVVAARRRADQSRRGDALACGRDRGQYRHGNTVEIGGTQIERAGRTRIAVRMRDIVVSDRDGRSLRRAPKAEVSISGTALLMGRLRAESLNLVDAELAVRSRRMARSGSPPATPPSRWRPASPRSATPASPPHVPAAGTGTRPALPAGADRRRRTALLAGLDWLDGMSLTGLDGQDLNEIGLKNGNLVVDDQQRGNKWTFDNISLSLRRPSGGGVALSVGEEGAPALVAAGGGRAAGQRRALGRHRAPTRCRPPTSCWRCG